MHLHANPHCPHNDPTVVRVRRLHDSDKQYELLQEIHRLRQQGMTLSDRAHVMLDLHEFGALVSIGVMSIDDFVRNLEAYVGPALKTGGSDNLADMSLWRIKLVAFAGRIELAHELLGRFYANITFRPELLAFETMARAFIAEAQGDTDAALRHCENAVAQANCDVIPCLHEFVATELARLFAKSGRPEDARATLLSAEVPAARVEDVMAAFA